MMRTLLTVFRKEVLDNVRDRVLADWRAEEVKAARAAFAEAVRSRYSIALPDPREVSLQ